MTPTWLIVITVMIPTFMEIMDISIVNVALDHIRGSLSAGIDESTWTITSYLVSNAIVIPMSGWLSRLFGRKRYLIFSTLLFTVSSFLCGAAWSLESLVFFRVLQGIGGGALQPLSQSILLETFPREKHGMAMGIFGIGAMFAPILGPLLGGIISDSWSWRWIFFINIPVGILSVLLISIAITDPPYMKGQKMRIDYWGLALLAIGVGCLQILLDKGERENWFDTGYITALAAISGIAMLAFIIVELFAEHPIVNLRILRDISFSSGNAIMFLAFLSYFSSIVIIPIYLQTLMGYTATLAGLVLSPGGIATLITMPFIGRMVTKGNPKILLAIGLSINACATYLLAQLNLSTDFNTVALLRVLLGFGIGFIFVPLTTLTLSTVPKEEMGNASAIFNFVRNLGGSFGVAIVATILARRAQFHQSRLAEHLTSFDISLQTASGHAAQALQQAGIAGSEAHRSGLVLIYRELLRQASMLSFNDASFVTFIFMLCIIPMVLLLRRGKGKVQAEMH